MELSDLVKREVFRIFTKSDALAVLKAFENAADEDFSIRVPLAIIFGSKGNYSEFLSLLKESQIDWRDVLVKTGLANDNWEQILIENGYLSDYHYVKWIPFDPSFLIEIVSHNLPDQQSLITELSKCTKAQFQSIAFISFVPENEWDCSNTIAFVDQKLGSITISIMKDGRIGSFEFGDKIK